MLAHVKVYIRFQNLITYMLLNNYIPTYWLIVKINKYLQYYIYEMNTNKYFSFFVAIA